MALNLRFRSAAKMSNPISLLLESEAATRRLAHLFQSEELDRTTLQSIAMVTRDSSGAARRGKNSEMPQEDRHERTKVCSRTRTVIRNVGSGASKRDLTVFSFMLALVLAGVVVAAQTDHPVFWLLIGPVPVAILHTTMTFVRQHVLRWKGRSCSANGLNYIRNSSNRNAQPDRRRCHHYIRDGTLTSAFIDSR
jgi:hypothetical protein